MSDLPAGPFVAWLTEQCDKHGRDHVRDRIGIGGNQLASLLSRGPRDTVRLSTVDSALTRWDGAQSLATLYPDPDPGPDCEPVRGGWTRPDLRAKAKLTDLHLRALHRAYMEQGVSINTLAKQVYERVGYKSHHSAAVAMSRGWTRLGLPRRDRIEGQGARDRDEQRRDARSSSGPDMVPMAPFAAWLEELRQEHGSMRAVAAITGLHYSAACRYVKGLDTAGRPKAMVSRRLVERARASVEAFDAQRREVAA